MMNVELSPERRRKPWTPNSYEKVVRQYSVEIGPAAQADSETKDIWERYNQYQGTIDKNHAYGRFLWFLRDIPRTERWENSPRSSRYARKVPVNNALILLGTPLEAEPQSSDATPST
jgi:hypothetical protein